MRPLRPLGGMRAAARAIRSRGPIVPNVLNGVNVFTCENGNQFRCVGQRVIFRRETIDNDYAEVDATVVSTKGEESSVIFKLRRVEDRWLVYDAVVENISIVNNYRSQFNRVIGTSSHDELLKKIREKLGL